MSLECSNETTFNVALKMEMNKEIKNYSQGIEQASDKLNLSLKPFQKKAFPIDVIKYESFETSRNFVADQVSKKNFYSENATIKAKQGGQELELYTRFNKKLLIRNAPKSLYIFYEKCINVLELCQFAVFGSIDAIYTKNEDSAQWIGWVDLEDFSVKNIKSEEIEKLILYRAKQKITRAIFSIHTNHKLEFSKDSIKNFILLELNIIEKI